MRLRKPCEHGQYDGHIVWKQPGKPACEGGEFLTEDALGAKQALDHVKEVIALNPERFPPGFRWTERLKGNIDEIARYFHDDDDEEILDALAVREGEG